MSVFVVKQKNMAFFSRKSQHTFQASNDCHPGLRFSLESHQRRQVVEPHPHFFTRLRCRRILSRTDTCTHTHTHTYIYKCIERKNLYSIWSNIQFRGWVRRTGWDLASFSLPLSYIHTYIHTYIHPVIYIYIVIYL